MLTIIVKLTNECNLSCSYCYRDTNDKGAISIVNIVRLIKQIDEIGKDEVTMIWHGGEPTMLGADYFSSVFSAQNKLKTKFTNKMQTNLVSIPNRLLDLLIQEGVDLGISIDIPLIKHDKNRLLLSGEGSVGRVVKNLNKIRERNVPLCVVSVVSDKDIAADDVIDFIEGFCPDSISLNADFNATEIVINSNLVFDLYSYKLSSDCSTYIREVDTLISMFSPVGRKGFCHYQSDFCGKDYLSVDVNGNIYICCDKLIGDTDFLIGNMFSDDLKTILDSDRYKSTLQKLQSQRAKCTEGCSISKSCNGGCICDNKSIKKNEICSQRVESVERIRNDFLERS
ncbi:radical SAM/SPASM domain-containing protein [Motilimonas eburnea]|uniref:radical SAM/SPASM domain-containing protein n=1 Tax=Motilimonas eburnea TaxID=1737488 RepID=UPI001E5EF264|nr:radical SAM protein [Motilimonas eburnea]MCE2571799.1 radical SAM protein [Motilimonas eburnea]